MCAIKAHGGGKSMLKQSLNLGKKMGFPKFGEVNFVKVAERIREDEQLAGTMPVEDSDSPIEAKIRKLHHQVERAAKRLPTEGKASDLNRLETLYRRIDKKLWSRVPKLTPPLEGLSPATLASCIHYPRCT